MSEPTPGGAQWEHPEFALSVSTVAERDALTAVVDGDMVNIEDREVHQFHCGKWITIWRKVECQ